MMMLNPEFRDFVKQNENKTIKEIIYTYNLNIDTQINESRRRRRRNNNATLF